MASKANYMMCIQSEYIHSYIHLYLYIHINMHTIFNKNCPKLYKKDEYKKNYLQFSLEKSTLNNSVI